jgi:transcription elongation factor Elf1
MNERDRIEARLMEYAEAAPGAVAARSQQRLVSYKTSIGNVFQCPRCWVEKAEQRRLHGISSGDYNDLFECRVCGGEFEISSERPF